MRSTYSDFVFGIRCAGPFVPQPQGSLSCAWRVGVGREGSFSRLAVYSGGPKEKRRVVEHHRLLPSETVVSLPANGDQQACSLRTFFESCKIDSLSYAVKQTFLGPKKERSQGVSCSSEVANTGVVLLQRKCANVSWAPWGRGSREYHSPTYHFPSRRW